MIPERQKRSPTRSARNNSKAIRHLGGQCPKCKRGKRKVLASSQVHPSFLTLRSAIPLIFAVLPTPVLLRRRRGLLRAQARHQSRHQYISGNTLNSQIHQLKGMATTSCCHIQPTDGLLCLGQDSNLPTRAQSLKKRWHSANMRDLPCRLDRPLMEARVRVC